MIKYLPLEVLATDNQSINQSQQKSNQGPQLL
jgi:hypothetical protein